MASFKLAALLLKQLTKPVAKRIESQMAENPWFKDRCVGFAQSVNRISVRFARNLSGGAKQDAVVLPLSENRAVQYGASLISEGIVFSVAGGLIVYEYGRKVRSDEHKKLQEEARRISVATALAEMQEEISLLRLSIVRHGIKVGATHNHHEQSGEDRVVQQHSLGDWWEWASGAQREAEQQKLEKRKEEMHARQLEAEQAMKKHEQAMAKRIAKQQEQSNQEAKIKESDEQMRADSVSSANRETAVATSEHVTAAGAAKEALKAIAEAAETSSTKAAAEPAKAAPTKAAVAATETATPHAASSPPSSSSSETLKDELPTDKNDGTLALSVASSLVVVGLVAASLCSSKPR